MKLSVVIVNYNVKYFLEQCLIAVEHACEHLSHEVFVVDNASSDGSIEMVSGRFPEINLVSNKQNVGFSKANNQAINLSKGEYVLLLNPDTVVAEDSFQKCIDFLDRHPEAGALGVRMIDGKGIFLPESKRGLPTPAVAFYKSFGLAALFPKSRTFGHYHLGYLSEKEIHEVDVLSGAFMMIRKEALDKVGLLDETFFMYGEDVDLSYRIQLGGYKNFYFPETTIIHYKGESTKRGSLNYVRVFYNAMIIFSKKHFGKSQSGLFTLMVNLAIILRGLLTLIAGLFSSSYMILIDATFSFLGVFLIKRYWEEMIKYTDDYYPVEFLCIVVPAYVTIWMLFSYLNGSYDKPYRVTKVLRGILMGTIAIAVLYAFLPNEWRFSRAIILLGAAWTAFEMLITRTTYHLIKHQRIIDEDDEKTTTMVTGSGDRERALRILRSIGYNSFVSCSGNFNLIKRTAAINNVTQIIFCSKDLSFSEIIATISSLGKRFDYKILSPMSNAMVGSNSKNTAGDSYILDASYALFTPGNQRNKKLIELFFSVFVIVLSPFIVFSSKGKRLIKNIARVTQGSMWWVGLGRNAGEALLEKGKPGVITIEDAFNEFDLTSDEEHTINENYALNYKTSEDVRVFFSYLFK